MISDTQQNLCNTNYNESVYYTRRRKKKQEFLSSPPFKSGCQTEDTHEVSIIWAEGKRMLRVTSIGLPADEAVLVAQSVKKIFAE